MAALRYSGNLVMRITVDREKITYKVSLSVYGQHVRTVSDIVFPITLMRKHKVDDPLIIDKAASVALNQAQFEIYASEAQLEHDSNGNTLIRRKPSTKHPKIIDKKLNEFYNEG